MPKLTIAATIAIAAVAIALLLPHHVLNASARLSQMAGKALPIARAALCYGERWHVLGLVPSCWSPFPYGGPVYPAAIYDPRAAIYSCCDDRSGYFPDLQFAALHGALSR
jgi:hypothetical protein